MGGRQGEGGDPGRMSRLDALLLALSVASLSVLPWLVGMWPAEEEPRRLAITHALLAQERPGSPYAGLVAPDALAHPVLALLAGAGRAIGVVAAGRLVCSLAIAGLCLAQWLLLRRLTPQRWTGIYLLLPLATGPLLLRGGTPLMLGLALGLVAVALVAPPLLRDEQLARRWPGAAAAAVLLALAGVTAPLALLLCAAALLLLAGRRLLARRAWPLAVMLALAALPGVVRAVEEWLAAPRAPPWVHARLDERVLGILGADLATFSIWEAVLRRLPVLCLLAGAALAIRRGGLRGSGATARLVVGALAIALLMPAAAGLAPCSEMAADALVWTACALAFSLPGRLPPAVIGAGGLALAATLTIVQSRAMRAPVAAIEQVVAVGRSVPRGSRVLPLRFGGGRAIDPLRHAWGHVALERDIVTPFLTGGGPLLSCASPLPAPALPLPHLGEDAARNIEAISPQRCAGVTEPAIDCGCIAWKAIRWAALLESARSYDRLLVISPPDELLAVGRDAFVPLARAGDVHLFALRRRAGPDPGLLCEPRP